MQLIFRPRKQGASVKPSKHKMTVLAQIFKLIPRNLIPRFATEFGIDKSFSYRKFRAQRKSDFCHKPSMRPNDRQTWRICASAWLYQGSNQRQEHVADVFESRGYKEKTDEGYSPAKCKKMVVCARLKLNALPFENIPYVVKS